MSRFRCRVSLERYTAWHRQVLSGFYDLAAAGVVDLHVRTGVPGRGMKHVMSVLVDDEVRVVYDMNDGYNFLRDEPDWAAAFDERLAECDVYFKYTCIDSVNGALRNGSRIRPLGPISINIGSPNNELDRGLRPFDARLLGKSAIARLPRGLVRGDRSAREWWPERSEYPPDPAAQARAVYVSRAFDPAESDRTSSKAERDELNDFRVRTVRLGREELGPRFLGGLEPTAYAVATYPDCVLDAPAGRDRHAYVDAVRGSRIGVTSKGLHRCASSKFAEFLAMSRAIVTQPLEGRMPGGLGAERNYLEGATPEGCVDAVARLLDDPDRIAAMMQANARYYESCVRPAAMVLRTLDEAVSIAGGGR